MAVFGFSAGNLSQHIPFVAGLSCHVIVKCKNTRPHYIIKCGIIDILVHLTHTGLETPQTICGLMLRGTKISFFPFWSLHPKLALCPMGFLHFPSLGLGLGAFWRFALNFFNFCESHMFPPQQTSV